MWPKKYMFQVTYIFVISKLFVEGFVYTIQSKLWNLRRQYLLTLSPQWLERIWQIQLFSQDYLTRIAFSFIVSACQGAIFPPQWRKSTEEWSLRVTKSMTPARLSFPLPFRLWWFPAEVFKLHFNIFPLQIVSCCCFHCCLSYFLFHVDDYCTIRLSLCQVRWKLWLTLLHVVYGFGSIVNMDRYVPSRLNHYTPIEFASQNPHWTWMER